MPGNEMICKYFTYHVCRLDARPGPSVALLSMLLPKSSSTKVMTFPLTTGLSVSSCLSSSPALLPSPELIQ